MSGLSLKSVIGHQTAVQLLQRTVASGRVAPGYLFFGPPQVGKRTLALAFAAALNCESGGEDACGVCLSCRKVADGTHPDVRVVEPEGSTFRIEQVREVSRQIALTPLEGRYKVYLLQKVETMRPEGANALLKTLEEPPGFGVLLLVTTNVNAILPTIRSRCQPIPLRPLPVRALEEELCRRGISPERAHRIALMAQGRVGAAFDLLESASEGETALRVPELLHGVRSSLLFRLAESWAADPGQLEQLLSWYRDLLLARLGAPLELWTFPEAAPTLQELARAESASSLISKMRALMESRYRLYRNANAALTMEALAFRLAQWPLQERPEALSREGPP